MSISMNTRRFVLSMIAALLLAVAIPSATTAQGRGQGKGHAKHSTGNWSDHIDRNRSNRRWRRNSNHDKKCGKFVNCHDARDGRIDGRGPRGTRVSNVWRSRTNRNNVWRNRRTVRRVVVNR